MSLLSLCIVWYIYCVLCATPCARAHAVVSSGWLHFFAKIGNTAVDPATSTRVAFDCVYVFKTEKEESILNGDITDSHKTPSNER